MTSAGEEVLTSGKLRADDPSVDCNNRPIRHIGTRKSAQSPIGVPNWKPASILA